MNRDILKDWYALDRYLTKNCITDLNFHHKFILLSYPLSLKIALKHGINFIENDFELLEVAIKYRYNRSIEILIDHYIEKIDSLFRWGFEREKNLIIDRDINVMAFFNLFQYIKDNSIVDLARVNFNVDKNFNRYGGNIDDNQ